MVCIFASPCHPYSLRTTSNRSHSNRIPPAVALAVAGYGVSAYRQYQTKAAAARDIAAAEAERTRRRAAAVLDDAYGDRSSLEGLERAVRVYEAQQRQQQQQQQ